MSGMNRLNHVEFRPRESFSDDVVDSHYQHHHHHQQRHHHHHHPHQQQQQQHHHHHEKVLDAVVPGRSFDEVQQQNARFLYGRRLSRMSLTMMDEPEGNDLQAVVDDHELVADHLNFISRDDRTDLKRCVYIAVTLGAIALLSITLGFVLSREDRGHGDGATLVRGDQSSSSSSLWREPPPYLDTTCAPMNLESHQGYSDCLHLCQPAKCCDFVLSNVNSCIAQHRNDCETYRNSCQHLDHLKYHQERTEEGQGQGQEQEENNGGSDGGWEGEEEQEDEDEYKAAPLVDDLCNLSVLVSTTAIQACRDRCDAYKCCFEPNTTDEDENDGEANAEEQEEEKKNDNDENGNAEKEKNDVDSVTGGSTEEDCDISDAWCHEVGVCRTLDYVTDEDDDGVPTAVAPPTSVEDRRKIIRDVCVDAGVLDRHAPCQNICQPARCCFLDHVLPPEGGGSGGSGGDTQKNDDDDDDDDDNHTVCPPALCELYQPCSILFGPPSMAAQQQSQQQPQSQLQDEEGAIERLDDEEEEEDDTSSKEENEVELLAVVINCGAEKVAADGGVACEAWCTSLMPCCTSSSSSGCRPGQQSECFAYGHCTRVLPEQFPP